MSLADSLSHLLREPTPTGLWQLRGDLLEATVPPDAPIWDVLDETYFFFNELASKATARQYSHFASLLDIGAVGIVVLSNLADDRTEESSQEEVLGRLLSAALSEGFMVLAARQYVKAWEEEMGSLYHEAAWRLYNALWRLSERMQPQVDPHSRRVLLDRLLAPLLEDETAGTARAMLIGRLYQLVLLAHVSEAAPRTAFPS